jgi:hypothetical protein
MRLPEQKIQEINQDIAKKLTLYSLDFSLRRHTEIMSEPSPTL